MSPIRTVRMHLSTATTASRGDLRVSRAGISSVQPPKPKPVIPGISRIAGVDALLALGKHPQYTLCYWPERNRYDLRDGDGDFVRTVAVRDALEITMSEYVSLVVDEQAFHSYVLTPAGRKAVQQ